MHAEQSAILSAARFGISVEESTLYTTLSPCFGCLKEAIQAGVRRIVYLNEYRANYEAQIQDQYYRLADHLRNGEPTNFEALSGRRKNIDTVGQNPDPGRQ